MYFLRKFPVRKGVLAAILIMMCWLAGFGAFTVHISSLTRAPDNERADAIVVLTGGAGRIRRGLELMTNGLGRQLFITGVNEQVDMGTILTMWPDENTDLITCCISLGHEAHNTRQNALEARKWITGVQNIKTVRLVTSSYHMPRALLEFRRAIPDITLIPEPIAYGSAPDHDRGNFWLLSFAEYNKTLLSWLRSLLFKDRIKEPT